jgi:hypothetical protein
MPKIPAYSDFPSAFPIVSFQVDYLTRVHLDELQQRLQMVLHHEMPRKPNDALSCFHAALSQVQNRCVAQFCLPLFCTHISGVV